jgi:hypothetical protein
MTAATLVLAAPALAALPPQGPPVQADQPAPATTIVGAPAPSSNPVFALASRTYRTMTSTSYSHAYTESTSTGVYDFDCVGAVDWFLSQAAPAAKTAMAKAEKIRTGYVPTPAKMYAYLSSKRSKKNFTRVRQVSNIQPGDVFILDGGTAHDGNPFVGHAMIAASGPLLLSDGGSAVVVYDSTGDPHGADDSRRWDTRAMASQANPDTLHSGLGFGTIEVHPSSGGAPTRMSWSVGVAEEPHPFLASRPKPERSAKSAPTGTAPAPS